MNTTLGRIELLPDPHLGRKFVNDVPLHRRGDREKMIWEDFEAKLANIPAETQFHITLGDLFDTPTVSPDTVLRAARAYVKATRFHTQTAFVILAGNHDIGRSLQPVSFDLFAAILRPCLRVHVIRDVAQCFGPIAVVPWSPLRTAAEIVSDLPLKQFEAIFGHWDMSGDVPNLLPVEELSKRTKLAVTGHDHKRRNEKRGDLDVICAGSMQPYAHGEDDGTMYRTCTLDTIPEDTRNLCLRVMLRKGEVPRDDIDAFQVQFRRMDEMVEEDALPALEDHNFSVSSLLSDAFQRRGINADIRQRLLDGLR